MSSPYVTMTNNYPHDNEVDNSSLWARGTALVSFSGISRFRRWLFPGVTAAVILIVIIAFGVSNTRTSNRLGSMEKTVSNLTDIIQSLNTSLQHIQKAAEFAAEKNNDQVASVTDALKHLTVLEGLSKSVAALQCAFERIINNSSASGGCCPLGWDRSESSCYYFSIDNLSWNDSRDWCDKHGAHLVIFLTDKEWEFVSRHADHVWYWVGLSDWRTGRWEWVNQTPYMMNRKQWVPGQPDSSTDHGQGRGHEDCAHLHSTGRLKDAFCSTRMRYICQKNSLSI
ncbi:C-type lectin domain family 10 member A-like [Scomber japonicus]|uniref:C-type lectin domain family 10 member A-like n=1 Tax=Scomber japonicus TaxID=13676 RepID=UPI00230617DA|nr:C-type lectin domain family 10 member A-like [Scomber japonicus]